MPITTGEDQTHPPQKIFTAPRGGKMPDRKQVLDSLARLSAKRGSMTERDVRLLEHLRELHVLSLDQIRRLFWPQAGEATAYNRLYYLARHTLLAGARVPAGEMAAWGLPRRRIYTLGPGGWLWLKSDVSPALSTRHFKRELVLHDLLVAEIYVRLVEAVGQRGPDWRITWAGESAASFYDKEDFPVMMADALAVLEGSSQTWSLFLELDKGREAHGRPSSDWGRKCHGYDRFYSSNWRMHPQLSSLPEFPGVAVITHGERRLQNLAEAISRHRRGGMTYYLALWQSLIGETDILAVPAWMILWPDGRVTGEDPGERVTLIQVGPDEAAGST